MYISSTKPALIAILLLLILSSLAEAAPTPDDRTPAPTRTPTATPTPVYLCNSTMQQIPGGYQITTICVEDDAKG